jgi:S-adenosylmethionine synthetase
MFFRFICLFFLLQNVKALAQPTPALIPYRKDSLWGFSNVWKKIIIPCEYQEVKPFVNELAKVKKNGKWGLIDEKGKIFVPCEYDLIFGASKKHSIIVCKGGDKDGHNGKWGLVTNYQGGEIPLNFDLIRECFFPNLWGAMKDNKWGVINRQGFWQVQPNFDVSTLEKHIFKDENNEFTTLFANKQSSNIYQKIRFLKGRARVGKQNLWGFINEYGNPLLPLEFDYVSEYINDWVMVKKDNKMGFYHFDRIRQIPLEYDWDKNHYLEQNFSENLVQVKKNGLFGYINPQNEVIIPFQFYAAHSFKEEVALVNTSPDLMMPFWKVIDKKGNILYEIDAQKYTVLDEKFEGNAIRLKDKTTKEIFLVDTKGNFIHQKGYKQVNYWYDGYWQIVDNNHKLGFWHKDTQKQIPLEYDFDLEKGTQIELKNNHFKVCKNGKWGLINQKNKIILPFIYENLILPEDFKPEFPRLMRIAYKENNLWGLINLQGKKVVKNKYQTIQPFQKNGLTKVQYKDKIGFIDGIGTEFWE